MDHTISSPKILTVLLLVLQYGLCNSQNSNTFSYWNSDTVFMENDTLFFRRIVEVRYGDTCIMNHFYTPASNADYQIQLSNFIKSNPFSGFPQDVIDTAYVRLKEFGPEVLQKCDLKDFPRKWCEIWPYRGKFYRSADSDERLFFTDSMIVNAGRYFFYIALCTFEKRNDGCYTYTAMLSKYGGGIEAMETVSIYPILNVPNLYLFNYYYDDVIIHHALMTPLECLDKFDFIDYKCTCPMNYRLDYDDIPTLIENGTIMVQEMN